MDVEQTRARSEAIPPWLRSRPGYHVHAAVSDGPGGIPAPADRDAELLSNAHEILAALRRLIDQTQPARAPGGQARPDDPPTPASKLPRAWTLP